MPTDQQRVSLCHHDQSGRWGVLHGKVFIRRRGVIPRDKHGAPIAFGPESVTRGDVILDFDLNPLRRPRRMLYR